MSGERVEQGVQTHQLAREVLTVLQGMPPGARIALAMVLLRGTGHRVVEHGPGCACGECLLLLPPR